MKKVSHESRFRTLRHIETVRNFISTCIKELLSRQEQHDQSKLESPELENFDQFTPKLLKITYGSDAYNKYLEEMKPALAHHYANNRHHPEHFPNGVNDMTLIDILEMLCDWKASSMRHNDGNILKSIEMNTERFKMDPQLVSILKNTVNWIETQTVEHKVEES